MTTHLLLDSGNTRLKWAFSAAGVWTTGTFQVCEPELSTQLDEAWAANIPPPNSLTVAHVGTPARLQIISAWAQQRWGCTVHVVQAQTELLGVRNSYSQPETLGADRWTALIGARALTDQSTCVIDCGTAVTIDALSENGEFMGGVILPGLTLQRDALLQRTAQLKYANGNDAQCLARSTADAIAAGTLFGLVGAVERVLHEFENAMDEELQLIITGGNADEIAARLARPAQREPDLVLKGLARIAGFT